MPSTSPRAFRRARPGLLLGFLLLRCGSAVVVSTPAGEVDPAQARPADAGLPPGAPSADAGPGDSHSDAGDGPGVDAGLPLADAGAPVADAGPPAADAGAPAADAGACQPSTWVDGRPVHGASPPLVREDPGCGLTYGLYAPRGSSAATELVPDFSFAGYEGGGVPIPDVAAAIQVSPVTGDNRAHLQAALDAAAALPLGPGGFRGAVVLAPGRYEVNGTLYLRASGVVLRGAGQSPGGSVLVATLAAQHDLLRVEGGRFREVAGSHVPVSARGAPVGSRTLALAGSHAFAVGDEVAVVRTPNQAWVDALGMGPYGWTPDAFEVAHGRKVVAVAGNLLTVDAPLTDSLVQAMGGGAVARVEAPRELDHCGVEDLRFESLFASPDDEAHGWNAIAFDGVRDGWVRRVTSVAFGHSAVELTGRSRFNTVEEVAQLDPVSLITGGRRYSFYVDDGASNLFQRCYARNGRHNFVTGARVPGPNVWVDSVSVENHSDEGPHHRWATGVLLDNVKSEELRVQNRANAGTGHGWAGAQVMFWNVEAQRITSDAPPGAMNWVVGGTGAKTDGSWVPAEPFGTWEAHGTRVAPRSLYFAQLAARRGAAAVTAVTTPAQRSGALWPQLAAWAGQERLDAIDPARAALCPGLLRDDVCCAAACGSCGGTGCGSRPGGSTDCCTGSIRASGRSCTQFPPPCVVP